MSKGSKDKNSVDFKSIFPAEITGNPSIEILSNRQLTLDGCKGIIEYSDYTVKIKSLTGILAVSGQNLNIKYLSVSSVIIAGKISSVEFIDWR